jgi:hypothetical protein
MGLPAGEPVDREDIGERGQWLFSLLMTDLCGRDDPFFRPRFLGDKYPTFDYIVEVVDRPSYFFFVQVKGTTLGYTAEEHRLRVQVTRDDIDRMVACPAPTYVVGIDVNAIGVGFLLSVNEPRDHVASLTTRFRIDCGVLEQLRDEVIDFWSSRNMALSGSRFRE